MEQANQLPWTLDEEHPMVRVDTATAMEQGLLFTSESVTTLGPFLILI